MSDPLADAIWNAIEGGPYLSRDRATTVITDAVRGHLAAVLDAAAAECPEEWGYGLQAMGWRDAIDSIRDALGVAPTARAERHDLHTGGGDFDAPTARKAAEEWVRRLDGARYRDEPLYVTPEEFRELKVMEGEWLREEMLRPHPMPKALAGYPVVVDAAKAAEQRGRRP